MALCNDRTPPAAAEVESARVEMTWEF